jgi:hypothetical protein
MISQEAYAVSVTLRWNANTESDLAGYKAHCGVLSGKYNKIVDVGLETSYIANGLWRGWTYYFALSAYDMAANESQLSAEVAVRIPLFGDPIQIYPPTGTTTTTVVTTTISTTTTTIYYPGPTTTTTVRPGTTTTSSVSTTTSSMPSQYNDCAVLEVVQNGDYGYLGEFSIKLDLTDLAIGDGTVVGQAAPGVYWKNYPMVDTILGQYGYLELVWPNGKYFEFSYRTTPSSWMDSKCSQFAYLPPGGTASDWHFRLKLGEGEDCPRRNINDTLIVGVERVTPGRFKIYLDFTYLPLMDYQEIFVWGELYPNGPWSKEIMAYDDYPCYYIDIDWPADGGNFDFTFCALKYDGVEECINPATSSFNQNGHLAINPNNY